MTSPIAAAVGVVFGLGLIASGMVNPAKVLSFLDIAGHWDPSLGLVMAGAISVAALAFALARRRTSSWLGLPMHWPVATKPDRRIVGGSVLFGVGWGLAGICPGPALVGLATGNSGFVIFVVAMLGGMALFELFERRTR